MSIHDIYFFKVSTYIYIYFICVCVCVYFLGQCGLDGKESACSVEDPGLIPGSGRSLGEGNGNPFLPGEFHGQRSLAGYSP